MSSKNPPFGMTVLRIAIAIAKSHRNADWSFSGVVVLRGTTGLTQNRQSLCLKKESQKSKNLKQPKKYSMYSTVPDKTRQYQAVWSLSLYPHSLTTGTSKVVDKQPLRWPTVNWKFKFPTFPAFPCFFPGRKLKLRSQVEAKFCDWNCF